MDFFYTLKEPVSKLSSKIFKHGVRIIPSDHKQVFLTLFFAIFATITGVGVVVPLLPVYAHGLGATGVYVAMIFASLSLSRTFFLPVFGRMSDKRGRKPFIVCGLFSYVLISIAFLFSKTVEQLIIIRFFQGMGSAMVMPVVQAYVGEITPEGSEGYSMGLFNLSMFLSLSLGPVMGGLINDVWSMNAAFICMGVLSGAGLCLCVWYLPPLSEEKMNTKSRSPVPWSVLLKDWELSGLFLFRFAYTGCIGIIWCFLPLFADSAFQLSGSQIGLLVMMGVFVSGVLQLPMGYAADRFNKNAMIIVGGLIAGLGMFMVYVSGSFVHLLLAVSLFGVGGGISMPAVTALAVIKGDLSGAMGSIMAVMTVAHSLGMFTGSVLAGLAMDFFNLGLAFPCGALWMVLGALGYLILGMQHFNRRTP